jgi:hypothetical protein
MNFDNIKILFLTLSLSVIFLLFASIFYINDSSYSKIQAIIEKSNCIFENKTKSYFCNLSITYSINENKISNNLIFNSKKSYSQGDKINIQYNKYNYLNIIYDTNYNFLPIISCICGILFVLLFIFTYSNIKFDILNKITNITDYFSFLL